jgi:hypothetical protein
MSDVKPENYDTAREWDGMSNLVAVMHSLNAFREELRAMAGVRFTACLAKGFYKRLCAEKEELSRSVEGCANAIEHHRLCKERLMAMKKKAEAELHGQIEEVLLSVSRAVSESVNELAGRLEESLSTAVDAWSDSCYADFRKLVTELEVEIRERMSSPSIAGFRQVLEKAEEDERKKPHSYVKVGKRLLKSWPAALNAYGAYAQAELDMSLKTAEERLKELEKSGKSLADYIKEKGSQPTFKGEAHAEKARQLVKWGQVLDSIGPLINQLGSIAADVTEEIMSARRAEERARRRTQIREQLRKEAALLEAQAAGGFNEECELVDCWLSERISTLEEKRADFRNRISELETNIFKIEDHLRRVTVPV